MPYLTPAEVEEKFEEEAFPLMSKQEQKHFIHQQRKQDLESEIKRHKNQVVINQQIIDDHDILPKEWHEGRIAEAEANIEHLQQLLQALKK